MLESNGTNPKEDSPPGDMPPLPPKIEDPLAALRLYIFHMLEYANYSGETYFDLGELAQMEDGTILIEFNDKPYLLSIEPHEYDPD